MDKNLINIFIVDNYFSIVEDKKNLGKDFRWAKWWLKYYKENPKEERIYSDYLRKKFNTHHLKVQFENNLNEPITKITSSNPEATDKFTWSEQRDKGTVELSATVISKLSDEEIYQRYSVDREKYKISAIYYKDQKEGFRMTVLFRPIIFQDTEKEYIPSNNFIESLSDIKPLPKIESIFINGNKPKASILIPKQDSHWNKLDINGNNSIEQRFSQFIKLLTQQLEKVRLTNTIEEINYIVGSDEFNSEWNSETTKGTPQQNILSYEEAFEKITEFNIETIKLLGYYARKVNVILLNGNHDRYSGWHLAHILKTVFKRSESIIIDNSINNTKIVSYESSLICLNHGDVIKPKDLAAKFPILAHEMWSNHSNYYVICGDKHHEVSHDYNGIMFYQVPQLSTAKSSWDNKMGFETSKAELLTFIFEEDGLSNIMRKIIK
jgi:hypothetical protein